MRITRLYTDHESKDRCIQVGCAIFEDGERLSEVFRQVGPFDEPWEELGICESEANALADGQIAGQARLWDDGPFV